MATDSGTIADSPRVFARGTSHGPEMIRELSYWAQRFRIEVLDMVYARQSGHIGGAFSAAEMLTALYFHHLRANPHEPDDPARDRLIFSKGHACAMLYTVLAYRGFYPTDVLGTFRDIDSTLQGHPEPAKTPGVEIPAGPLGHGICVGIGMALAAKKDAGDQRVYVICGDGELNSGVIWEGALLAPKFRVDNLTLLIDYNGVQQTGKTYEVLDTEPICDKWSSFGWNAIDIHGHNMGSVLDALDQADEVHGRPTVIVCRTTKGKGVSFMEGEPYWHGSPPTTEQYEAALGELREGARQWQA